MKQISGHQLAKLLEARGWKLMRHHIYGKSGSNVRLSIPIHGNQNLKRGLAAHLIKLSGIEESDID